MSYMKRGFRSRVISFKILLLLCVFFASFAVNSFGQDSELLRQKINSGTTEQKRDALYQIRNINTAETSRIALPALKDVEEIVRATATHSVLALSSDEACATLLPLLKDKSAYVREETAYALGKTKNLKAVEPLILILRKDKSIEARGAAAHALGQIGDIKAQDALIDAIRKRKNIFLESAAAYALGVVKSKKAVPILISVLKDIKRYPDVHRNTAWALGEIGDASAVELLKSYAASDDYMLAAICADSIKKITSAN